MKRLIFAIASLAFLLFTLLADVHAMEVTGATVDHSAQTIIISGSEFDKDVYPADASPIVTVTFMLSGVFEAEVIDHGPYEITIDASPFYDALINPALPPYTMIQLVVQLHIGELVEWSENGEDGSEFIEYDIQSEFCLGINPDKSEFSCMGLFGDDPVPVDRVVDWMVPNIPQGTAFAQFKYKFGPAFINDWWNNKWGDPVYWELLEDYEIDLHEYLYHYNENNFDDTLLDRCESGMGSASDARSIKGRLVAMNGKAWIDTKPLDTEPYIKVDNGILKIKKGFRWDGATIALGEWRLFPKPPTIMRASFVHDVIYDLMRLKIIKQEWLRTYPSYAFYNKKLADCMLYMLSRQDGYVKAKARTGYDTVRLFGSSKIKNKDLPDWKYHAIANAGTYEPTYCASNQPNSFVLNGTDSDDAIHFDWEVFDSDGNMIETASGKTPEVMLTPGHYVVVLEADDPSDDRYSRYYKDIDQSEFVIIADTIAPEFLLIEDIEVTNEPDQCSAEVDFKVIATDDCGSPLVSCTGFPGNFEVNAFGSSTFPVGITKVLCQAVDVNQSTEETAIVNVMDVEPPVIEGIAAPICIWPPNHKYETLHLADFVHHVQDNCGDVDIAISEVTSDEEDPDSNDIVLAPDGQSMKLRKERIASRNGRAYTVVIDAKDQSGNVSREIYEVHVPIDKNCQVINDGSL